MKIVAALSIVIFLVACGGGGGGGGGTGSSANFSTTCTSSSANNDGIIVPCSNKLLNSFLDRYPLSPTSLQEISYSISGTGILSSVLPGVIASLTTSP